MVPVTAGAAMLVPWFTQCTPSPTMRLAAGLAKRERADTMPRPGAATSGFCRPSRVGPAAEKRAMSPIASRVEKQVGPDGLAGESQQSFDTKAAAVTALRALPGELTM